MKKILNIAMFMLIAWLALTPAPTYAAKPVKVKNAHWTLEIEGDLYHHNDFYAIWNFYSYHLFPGMAKKPKRDNVSLQVNEGDVLRLYNFGVRTNPTAWTLFHSVDITIRDGFTISTDSLPYHADWKANISVEEKSDHWLIKIKPFKPLN